MDGPIWGTLCPVLKARESMSLERAREMLIQSMNNVIWQIMPDQAWSHGRLHMPHMGRGAAAPAPEHSNTVPAPWLGMTRRSWPQIPHAQHMTSRMHICSSVAPKTNPTTRPGLSTPDSAPFLIVFVSIPGQAHFLDMGFTYSGFSRKQTACPHIHALQQCLVRHHLGRAALSLKPGGGCGLRTPRYPAAT